jgi:hypothetical protein
MYIFAELTWARGLSMSASAGALLALAAASALMAAVPRIIVKYYSGEQHDIKDIKNDSSIKRSNNSVKHNAFDRGAVDNSKAVELLSTAMPALRPDEGIQSNIGITSSTGALGLHKNSGQFVIRDDYTPKK